MSDWYWRRGVFVGRWDERPPREIEVLAGASGGRSSSGGFHKREAYQKYLTNQPLSHLECSTCRR